MRSPCRALALLAVAAIPLRAQRLPPPANDSATVVYDDDGLRIHSGDGRRQLRLRGYLAADARAVFSDTADASPNMFAIRRARIVFDANVNPWIAFRMSVDVFNVGVSPITDAFADISMGKHWWLRAGKQKTPYGFERAVPVTEQVFPERSIASMLTSNREPGVLLTGEFGDGRYEASVGVFDGIPDGGASAEADLNDAKDGVLRLVFRPFIRSGGQGVTVGYNGTTGIERGTTANAQLPRFLSPSALSFFSYRESAGAVADGLRYRNGVFASAHSGRWGLNTEWFVNRQRVQRGALVADINTAGWLGLADYVLSGEPSVQGGVAPAHPFDPAKGHWGAVQAAARVAKVTVGHSAFPYFADSTVAANAATEIALGVNWFFTRNTKMQLNYERTAFQGGAATGHRKTEQLVLLRLQVYF